MKYLILLAVLVGPGAGLGWHMIVHGREAMPPDAPPAGSAPAGPSGAVAANGVVEGVRPEAALRPEAAGILASVPAREGQEVAAGQLLAELRNEVQKEQVALAKAEVAVARAELDRVRNGERAEKRKAAQALEAARQALFQQAEADHKRSQRLVRERSASAEQYDTDYFRMLRTKADYEQASAERALVEAPPRPDELAAADGRVAAAEARLRLAEAELAKTRLLAPRAGRVLQVYAEPGEAAGPASAQPVLLLADLSRRRVRAFVDELDAARVRPGLRAEVEADGYPGQQFAGRVVTALPRMGKRAPQSDTPGEYKDLYYREVLIELDGDADLPVNLRVRVRIPGDEAPATATARRSTLNPSAGS
jgi:multidrug resistance efflux pump